MHFFGRVLGVSAQELIAPQGLLKKCKTTIFGNLMKKQHYIVSF